MPIRPLLAAVIAGILVASTPARALEQVDIPSGGMTLKATLLRPSGAGPFPAIVAMHGCAGVAGRRSVLSPIYTDWGQRFVDGGYAVLFPDSFGSRGAGPQCTVRERHIRPRVERTADVNAARAWLQAQPWVRKERTYLVGWSHGGSTVLWAVRGGNAGRGDGDFRAAVAFYPGCRAPAQRAWSSRVPILVLIGAADDWTPAKPCEEMIAQARGRSARAEIVTYPNAYHAFDNPNLPIRQRSGLAYTADGSGQAHIGTEPAARQDAIRRVMEWLAR